MFFSLWLWINYIKQPWHRNPICSFTNRAFCLLLVRKNKKRSAITKQKSDVKVSYNHFPWIHCASSLFNKLWNNCHNIGSSLRELGLKYNPTCAGEAAAMSQVGPARLWPQAESTKKKVSVRFYSSVWGSGCCSLSSQVFLPWSPFSSERSISASYCMSLQSFSTGLPKRGE